ncbi:MAG: hypothetical protein Q7R47_04815 [Candidatus Diapherotrites archaeon]|nr:hypothetical protein [Candidatus Diapherotrites archaeon]
MPRKPKGTSVRKTADGQLEWTMRKPDAKPKWVRTKTGNLMLSAMKAAHSIVNDFATHDWVKRNPAIVGVCWQFIRKNPRYYNPDSVKTIQNALNSIRKTDRRKKKEVPGQMIMDFEMHDPDIPF